MNNYTIEIAKNTKDHQILTEILKRGKNDYVSCYAALNPNCPPEVLAEVLRRGKDDYVSYNAAQNLQQQENEQNKLLKIAKSKYTNPILSLEL